MSRSHADNHDLDKLTRWRRDLVAGPAPFPVYAVFLVSPEDRLSHDIFREYRAAFQARSADYAHLVIFGQHGVSSTVRGLLDGLGLPLDALPLLALFCSPSSTAFLTLPLEPGESSSQAGNSSSDETLKAWRKILDQVEASAVEGGTEPDLAGVPQAVPRSLDTGSMVDLIEKTLGHA